MAQISFGILTVSDRCSRGESEDKSGQVLADYINTEFKNAVIVERKCVPDEISQIQNVLINWCDILNIDVIVSTGGTGFSPRDVTPEATRPLIDREAPGFSISMFTESLKITPFAMLSRAVVGIRKKCLIVNLPGSAKGSLENFRVIAKQIPHTIDVIRDSKQPVDRQHFLMNTLPKSKVNLNKLVDRDRKTAFKMIEVSKAQEIILEKCELIQKEAKIVSFEDALGSIIAEDIYSKEAIPPFPASIKDGYAVKVTNDMDTLTVIGDSTCGDDPNKCEVREGFCVRISTGGPVPKGADGVIQVEDTILIEKTPDGLEEKTIKITSNQVSAGQDIRPIGSDVNINQKILEKFTKLGPTDIGTLAAVGVSKFSVFKKPYICLLSTGNELQSPLAPAEFGKIRDSNKTTLKCIFEANGFKTIDIGIAKDTPDQILQKLIEGFEKSDLLLTTGGVSMGEKDFLKQVLVQDLNAEIHFGNVFMKPGKPTVFATCIYNGRNKLIFSLPGNPVSSTVTSILFVLPALRRLSGWIQPFNTTIKAKLGQDLKLDKVRPEYHRVNLNWDSTEGGFPIAISTGNQISSRLTSCNTANGLSILPNGTNEMPILKKGSIVDTLIIDM